MHLPIVMRVLLIITRLLNNAVPVRHPPVVLPAVGRHAARALAVGCFLKRAAHRLDDALPATFDASPFAPDRLD
jgi:hypothetical protein